MALLRPLTLSRRKRLTLWAAALALLLWAGAGVTWLRGRAAPAADLTGGAAIRPELAAQNSSIRGSFLGYMAPGPPER